MTEHSDRTDRYPLLTGKRYQQPSLFRSENLLREGRRQKRLPEIPIPAVALLDPDGDIVRHLAATGRGRRHLGWACYDTDMWVTDLDGIEAGVVGMAVGAPFAVLVAEQLAASGARLVISITFAGHISSTAQPPYFLLIDRALRDEGTSAHYQPPATWSRLPEHLAKQLTHAFSDLNEPVHIGRPGPPTRPTGKPGPPSAPRKREASCASRWRPPPFAPTLPPAASPSCAFAHITNTIATEGDDFEKGNDNGATASLSVAHAAAAALTDPRADSATGLSRS